jgi:Right handed beta helix region
MQRKPMGVLVAAVLAATASLLALVAPASADHVDVVRPGESIQAAVDAAEPGDKIFVKRGRYAENVVITTDGITLKSRGAKLVPPAEPAANACSFEEPARDGICAIGDITFPDDGPPTVNDPISDVKIKGFKVKGFPGTGIIFLGAEDPVVKHNRTKDNGEYGIARFFSTGGKIVGNAASGSEEAGIYVGDSPDADVLIARNHAFDNGLFGFFLRDAANGRVVANHSYGNCVGAIVLNTGPNIAGDWKFFGNRVYDNDKFCPANEEEGTPAFSGIGIAIANASNNKLYGNVIKDNNPSGEVPFSGGVVVVDAGIPGANPPSGNVVKGNVILGNEPDIFWDGSGEGNVIAHNLCETSVPEGLCERRHRGDHHHHGDKHHHGDHHHGDKHHGDRDHHGDKHHGGKDHDHGDRDHDRGDRDHDHGDRDHGDKDHHHGDDDDRDHGDKDHDDDRDDDDRHHGDDDRDHDHDDGHHDDGDRHSHH